MRQEDYMHEYQQMVLDFHRKFGLTINEQPTIPSDKDAILRVNLIMEESGELLESAASDLRHEGYYALHDLFGNRVVLRSTIGIADACADMLYVIYGAGITYGLELAFTVDETESFGLGRFPAEGIRLKPAWLDEDLLPLLGRKCMEVNRRFAEATIRKDLKAIRISLESLLAFTHASALAAGIKIDAVFREVQRSNMSKIWPDGSIRRREEDGKILKPPTYSPADIKGVLEKQYLCA
jgi:predicted HAD superfamily Cof-like phosphohydrolase